MNNLKGLVFKEGQYIKFNNAESVYVYKDEEDNNLYLIGRTEGYNKAPILIPKYKESIPEGTLILEFFKGKEVQGVMELNKYESKMELGIYLSQLSKDTVIEYRKELYYVKEDFWVVSKSDKFRGDSKVLITDGVKDISVKYKSIATSESNRFAGTVYNKYKEPSTRLLALLVMSKSTDLSNKVEYLELKDKLETNTEDEFYGYVLEYIKNNVNTNRVYEDNYEGLVTQEKYKGRVKNYFIVEDNQLYTVKSFGEQIKQLIEPKDLKLGILKVLRKQQTLFNCLSILGETNYFKTKRLVSAQTQDSYKELTIALKVAQELYEDKYKINKVNQTRDMPTYLKTVLTEELFVKEVGIKVYHEPSAELELNVVINFNENETWIETTHQELKEYFEDYLTKLNGKTINENIAQDFTTWFIRNYKQD